MNEKIINFAKRIEDIKSSLETEEATKTALIMPFFNLLGYDIFNPTEFIPEFTCDVGIKKGEKVDYAIKLNDKVEILVEAKSIGHDLSKVDSQLSRYFHVSDANIAIMTDGVTYRFYSDLDKENVMDNQPFFEFNLTDLTQQQIIDIEKFQKIKYNKDEVLSLASNLKSINIIKDKIIEEFTNPSYELVKLLISEVYSGPKTKVVIDSYIPFVKKAYQQVITDKITKKLNDAILGIDTNEEEIIESKTKIETTEEELQFYQIVKSLVIGKVDISRIKYRDTESYFNILLDGNGRKWICRIKFIKDGINIYLNDGDTTLKVEKLDDIFNYKNEILTCLDNVL